jgi:hypothetical protein
MDDNPILVCVHEVSIKQHLPDRLDEFTLKESVDLICRGFTKDVDIDFLEIIGELWYILSMVIYIVVNIKFTEGM